MATTITRAIRKAYETSCKQREEAGLPPLFSSDAEWAADTEARARRLSEAIAARRAREANEKGATA